MSDPKKIACSPSKVLGLSKDEKQNDFENKWKSYVSLRSAIQSGSEALAISLIKGGAMVNPNTGNHITPLHMSIHLGCPKLIKTLLDHGASVNETWHRESPILLSVRLRKFHLTDLLLTANNLNILRRDSFTLMNHLHVACLRGQINAVEKLVKLGADVNQPVREKSFYWPGYTPLHLAVESQCIDLVQFLLDSGASIMKQNSHSCTPLHLAHEIRNTTIIDILLIAHMYQLGNPMDSEGLSHFHIACTRNNVDVLEYFLAQGCDVNEQIDSISSNELRCTPLKLAIEYECPDVVEVLLQHNAEVTIDEYNKSLMLVAYDIGNEKIISLLLMNSSKRAQKVSEIAKLSDFQKACVTNNPDKIAEIVNRCANNKDLIPDINVPVWKGCVPLHYSISNYPKEIIKAFKLLGANVAIRDSRMKTPLHVAFGCLSHDELESIICDLVSVNQNPADSDGLTHFHIACTTNQSNLIHTFLKIGKDTDRFVNDDSIKWGGYGPLHFAAKYRRVKNVEILLKFNPNFILGSRDKPTAVTPIDVTIMNLDRSFSHPQKKLDIKILKRILLKVVESSHLSSFDSKGLNMLHVACLSEEKINFGKLAVYINSHPEAVNQPINYPNTCLHYCTPLHFAMRRKNIKLAQWLLKRGADLFTRDANRLTPFDYEIYSGGKFHIIEENPAVLCVPDNPTNSEGLSYFHIGCKLANIEIMKYYLNSGVNINLRTTINSAGRNKYRAALHLVIKENTKSTVETVTFLLEHGADATAPDAFLSTPLHLMRRSSYSVLVDELVNHGADVNAQNIFGQTPLHAVCRFPPDFKEAKDNIIALLENGADINIIDRDGRTAFTSVEDLDPEEGYEFDDETKCALLKHAKKLEVLGRHLCDVNRKDRTANSEYWSSTNYNEKDFEQECLKEIMRMKCIKIDRHITLYRVLSKNPNQMVDLCKNSTFQEIIQSDKLDLDYPIYGYLLKLQYKTGLIRQHLLEKCMKFWNPSLNLPKELSEIIFSYLHNNDLQNIVKSMSV